MRLLLDTHLLIWAAQGARVLPARASDLIADANNEIFFSAASIWEVVIKSSLKREDFSVDPRLLRLGLIRNGYQELSITTEHCVSVASLPDVHKDPFDRILIAQAILEGLTLLTSDSIVSAYPGPIISV